MACAAALRFVGPINIQCRIVDGRPVIFEINPRFSGGIPLTIEAGADFPLMLAAAGARPPRRAGDRPLPRRLVDDQLRGVGVHRRSPLRLEPFMPVAVTKDV